MHRRKQGFQFIFHGAVKAIRPGREMIHVFFDAPGQGHCLEEANVCRMGVRNITYLDFGRPYSSG